MHATFSSRNVALKSFHGYAVVMISTEWQINIREEKLTLLEALSLRVPAAPRAFLRQLLKKRRIAVDRHPAETDRCVHAGEIITVSASQRWRECLEQSRIQPAQILYEDAKCMVIDKPAGLAIHHAHGHDDDLLLRVQNFLQLRGENFQVAPIQRLDIGTSGAVLFGKGRASISQLGQEIMAGQVTKRYLALVGDCILLPGELNTVVPAKGSIKQALTRFRPVSSNDRYTLLELELGTGRHHQIRHQLAKAGWPIIGDTRYGGKDLNMNRPFLHCHFLAFQQPGTSQIINIGCPLPEDLSLQLKTLGFTQEAVSERALQYSAT